MEHIANKFGQIHKCSKKVPKMFIRCPKDVQKKAKELMETTVYQIETEIFFSTKKVLEKLKVSLSTLRRTTALLRDELPSEIFDKAVNERGYSVQAYGILKQYFRLRSQSMPVAHIPHPQLSQSEITEKKRRSQE